MTWEFGDLFSYVSSTFLYLPGPKIQAINPGLLAPKFSRTNKKCNDYWIVSVYFFFEGSAKRILFPTNVQSGVLKLWWTNQTNDKSIRHHWETTPTPLRNQFENFDWSTAALFVILFEGHWYIQMFSYYVLYVLYVLYVQYFKHRKYTKKTINYMKIVVQTKANKKTTDQHLSTPIGPPQLHQGAGGSEAPHPRKKSGGGEAKIWRGYQHL